MITLHHRTTLKVTLVLLTIAATAVAMLAGAVAAAQAAPVPVKLALSSHITNGFSYSLGVAVNEDPSSLEHGYIYVTDKGNHRVQVLSPTGAFIEMFGQEVNETTKENLCTAASHETCQAGVSGSAPGQFSAPSSIAIDPATGDVYVAETVFGEFVGQRVQEFTAEGRFLLEIGREVNTTKDKEPLASEAERNLCSETEIEGGGECGGPAQTIVGSSEDGAFNFETTRGDLLAVGGAGPKDLLYVGDDHRVQEFEASGGKWVGEIALTSLSKEPESRVQALALDQETGDLYLNYAGPLLTSDVIREFDPETGEELASFPVSPRKPGQEVIVEGMALDPSGRLAVTAFEHGLEHGQRFEQGFGSLYDPASGRRVTEFAFPNGVTTAGIGFGGAGELYVTGFNEEGTGEVLTYTPEPIGELTIGGSGCAPGVESGTSATFVCTLKGEVNPEGVAGTEAFFAYGRTPRLGETTTPEKISATEPVHTTVVGLRPNETYYYGLAGFDSNEMPPEEPFASVQASLATETVAPHIGAPSVIAARPSSVVLFSELNPENASTEYYFEYAASEHALAACTPVVKEHGGCPGVQNTPTQSSVVYGGIGAEAEITGLQPGATYHFRLFAEDESAINPGERFPATGPEDTVTTEPTPLPSAQTGSSSAVTSTGAVISGAVNPDGVPAGYAFEVGVYNGANTQYTIVYSAEAGSGNAPVEESLPLTGLQPGTTYAYRIAVSSGYIPNEAHALQGAPVTFTTAGSPSVLALPLTPALVPVPAIVFPKEEKGSGTTVKTLTNKQKLAKALAQCKKDHKKSKRQSCQKAAHRKFGSVRKKSKSR
jgi:hypothetical protein